MRCAYCNYPDSKVLDSRSVEDMPSIRRRRECLKCSRRFTTFETIETTPTLVIKSDKTRELFDINKIKKGVISSCQKRPIAIEQIDNLANNIYKKISVSLEQEIKSSYIGELVMDELKKLDDVAYVRFASVYRKFTDVSTFVNFIQDRLDEIEIENDRK